MEREGFFYYEETGIEVQLSYFSCTDPRTHLWCSHCAGSYPLLGSAKLLLLDLRSCCVRTFWGRSLISQDDQSGPSVPCAITQLT